MKFWRLILPILFFGALFRVSSEESLPELPMLQPSAYASEMEEAFVAVCEQIGNMAGELPLIQNHATPVWHRVLRKSEVRTVKSLRPEVGVRSCGSWSAPVIESYHLAFFAEPRPVERLRVLRRLRI